MIESLQNINVQHLASFSAKDMPVDILRLDQIHAVVSGNKWFKLKYYLQEATAQGKTTIATFGGAYSNHIVATAFAAKEAGLKSTGFIRGEKTDELSPTLRYAESYGMEIIYIGRDRYRDKNAVIATYENPAYYWVMEGGYGEQGSKGAGEILQVADTSHYSHILCAVGTGTMLAGLVNASLPQQQVIGISALKNNLSILQEVKDLLVDTDRPFTINHDYHFSGYAKHPSHLLSFMKELWLSERLPTDIVYTSKLLFAARDLIARHFFPPRARILLIHSGGLQGNRSLPAHTLPFL